MEANHQSRLTLGPCPLCKNPSSTLDFAFRAPDQAGRIPGLFPVYRCSRCRSGVTEIAVDNALLHEMYDEYYDTKNVVRQEAHPLQRRYRETHLRRIRSFARGTNLLDIGCGPGVFVKAAGDAGLSAMGVDISQVSVDCGKQLWGLNLVCATIDDFLGRKEYQRRFDIITLYSVLEHIAEPVTTLAAIRPLLTPGGLVVVEVPNFRSIQARFFGAHWFNLDVPRHLFHYSPEGLQHVVHSAGFDVLATRPGPASLDFGIAASLMPMPESGESLLHKIVRKLVVTPFGRMLVPVEHMLGSAGSVEIYATPGRT